MARAPIERTKYLALVKLLTALYVRLYIEKVFRPETSSLAGFEFAWHALHLRFIVTFPEDKAHIQAPGAGRIRDVNALD